MSDWQITTLGEIINTGNGLIQTGPFGSQLHASDYVSLGVPVIMPINLVDNRISLDDVAYITDDDANRLAKHILKAGDIVYSRRGDVTRKALITEKEEGMFCGTGCLLIRPGYKVESKFLAYFLSTPSSKEWIIRHAVGATMPNLNTSILSKVPLLLPDFSMQKRIAKILGDLDNKITLNRQINQTLEAMAQALFKSWFVDFDPVKAKLSALAAGGSANDANLAAMSAISGKTTEQLLTLKTTHPDQFQQLYTTADLFPSEMVDSELGEIPKGWEVKAFGDLLKTTIGGDWGKDEPDDKHTEEVKILRGTDLPKVFLGDDTGVPIRYVEAKKLKTRIIETGDIVIEVSGGSKDQPTGRSLFVNQTLINRLNARLEPASFCRLFKPFSEKIGLFLGTYLQKIYQEGKTWHYQNQSTGISNFQTNTFLEKERLIVPCDNLLTVFYAHASPILGHL